MNVDNIKLLRILRGYKYSINSVRYIISESVDNIPRI